MKRTHRNSNNDAQIAYDVLEIVKKEVSVAAFKHPQSVSRFFSTFENVFFGKKPPFLKNVFSFVFAKKSSNVRKTKDVLVRNCNLLQTSLRQNSEKIQDNICGKIKSNSSVLVHGLNFEIECALLRASREGKKFKVLMTKSPFSESCVLFVKKLLKNNVFVEWYPASAARQALKNADVVILGAEAVSSKKIVTEMGGELFAELAVQRDVPIFAVSSSFRFHDDIDINSLRSNLSVGFKLLFEKVEPSLITGIISERGVHSHSVFVNIVNNLNFKSV